MTFRELISNLPHTKTELSVWVLQMSLCLRVDDRVLFEVIADHTTNTLRDFFEKLQNGKITEEDLVKWYKEHRV